VPVVRFFAAARAAARADAEEIPAGTLDQLLADLAGRYGERMAILLKSSSFLVDGVSCRDPSTVLGERSTVDVLPPFAGG
jgi:molybdopterin synthase sulfur carrier subunit